MFKRLTENAELNRGLSLAVESGFTVRFWVKCEFLNGFGGFNTLLINRKWNLHILHFLNSTLCVCK